MKTIEQVEAMRGKVDLSGLDAIASRNGTTVGEIVRRTEDGKCWRCGGDPFKTTPSGRHVCARCALELIVKALDS